jgi:hypothetical protein
MIMGRQGENGGMKQILNNETDIKEVKTELPKKPGIVTPIPEEEKTDMKRNKKIVIGVYIILIAFGIGTGYLLARGVGSKSGIPAQKYTTIKTDTVSGSTDATTFKDSAEGVIEKGGSEGEGSHKLIRDGGPSQTAYLISSIVDLDEYVGKKVRVWGQTMAAQNVSWLMDVGKIELLSE